MSRDLDPLGTFLCIEPAKKKNRLKKSAKKRGGIIVSASEPSMKGITFTKDAVYVEPSSVGHILKVYSSSQSSSRAGHSFSKRNATDALADKTQYANLFSQAGSARSISCISALYLNLHLHKVPRSIGDSILQCARCAYGRHMEESLRLSMHMFLGSQGIKNPSKRTLTIGTLCDGRDVILTGRCDAVISSRDASGNSCNVPVEIKSRTRVERFGSLLKGGSVAMALKQSSVGEMSSTSVLSSVGKGDALQILCYMAMYESKRALYIQCARVGIDDPIMPLMCEMVWDSVAFSRMKSGIIQRIEELFSIPRVSKSKKLGDRAQNVSPATRPARRTRLMVRCAKLISKSSIHKRRTRSQTKAIQKAIRISTPRVWAHLQLKLKSH